MLFFVLILLICILIVLSGIFETLLRIERHINEKPDDDRANWWREN